MDIKIKVKPKFRQIIEDQLKRWEDSLPREQKLHEEKMAQIQSRIVEYKNFWAVNEKEICDWEQDNIRRYNTDTSKLHETQAVWGDRGKISISSCKPISEWVCKFCGNITIKKFFRYSDSRYDTDIDTCDCEGAAKFGKPYNELTDD